MTYTHPILGHVILAEFCGVRAVISSLLTATYRGMNIVSEAEIPPTAFLT